MFPTLGIWPNFTCCHGYTHDNAFPCQDIKCPPLPTQLLFVCLYLYSRLGRQGLFPLGRALFISGQYTDNKHRQEFKVKPWKNTWLMSIIGIA